MLAQLKQEKYRWLVTPIVVFAITRGLLFVTAYAGQVAFLGKVNSGPWHTFPNNLPLDIRDRWDSPFFRSIADSGYTLGTGTYSNLPFFPMYPLLLAVVKLIVQNSTVAGILVSNICLLIALIFLYRLTLLEFSDHSTSRRALYYLVLFPTAFFFGAVYSESTFLLFSVAAFYFARRRMWFWAGAAGAFASATRFIGILLYGVVLLEWLRAQGWTLSTILQEAAWRNLGQGIQRDWRGLIFVHLVPLGLIGYMLFLNARFGDPFAFLTAEAAWGRHTLANPFATIWQGLSAFFNQKFLVGSPRMWQPSFDILAATLGLVITPFIWRRLGDSYALYTILSVLIPAATGRTLSMARFVVVIFPIFMLLGLWGRNSTLDKALTIGFALLLSLLSTVFVNWGFVG